jgi:hypothetical protein
MEMQTMKWRGEGILRLYQGYQRPYPANEEFGVVLKRAYPVNFAILAECIALSLLGGTDQAPGVLTTLDGYSRSAYMEMTTKMRLQLCHLHLLVYMAEHQDCRVSEVHDSLRFEVQTMRAIFPHYQQAEHDLDILTPLLDVTNPVIAKTDWIRVLR